MIEANSLKRAYIRLKSLYENNGKETMRNKKFRMVHNPVKNAFEIAGTKECVLKSTNVMCATLNGSNITKVISIDDVTGITKETVVYTDRYMRTTIREDIGLTHIRCGIMAVLSADLNYKITKSTKVGFIGNGNINQKTMEVLNILFGVDSCVIRGSKENRSKNKEIFDGITNGLVIVDDTDDCRLLNECEIVFCCTSSYKKEDMISNKQLNNPNILIVQDSGYILDESFRKGFRINYTDHEEQLYEHYKAEFPHDKKRRYMNTMMNTQKVKAKKAVYLYGIALSDLIVYEEFFHGR